MLSIEERKKKALEGYSDAMNKRISESDALFDKQTETTKKLYDGKIQDTEQNYEDLFRQNEVQKYINAREVAENNANLGLTDSGLNRTQQTAVQLSASNNEAKIRRARQGAVDSLTREMTALLTDIENNKYSAQSQIKSGYEQLASEEAVEGYKADLEAYNKQVEANSKAQSAKNSAYSALVKDLYNGRNSDNPYDKNTVAALIKAYVDEHGYSDVSELSAILSAGGITEDEFYNYYTKGITNPISEYMINNPVPTNLIVNKATLKGNGIYYEPRAHTHKNSEKVWITDKTQRMAPGAS